MKTFAATAALTIMFLSAGAFAGSSHRTVHPAGVRNANLTVIEKNQNCAAMGLEFVAPCNLTRSIGS